MRNLRRDTARFFYRNRDKGIPNLMFILIGIKLLVFLLSTADASNSLLLFIRFSPYLILEKGQIWRLFTYIFMPDSGGMILFVLSLMFYYWAGTSVEMAIGRLKFDLYYLATVLILDAATLIAYAFSPIYAELFGYMLSSYLTYALVFALATVNSSNVVLLFFILPVRLKYLAWLDLGYLIYGICTMWRSFGALSLIGLTVLIPYFLFFHDSWRVLLPGNRIYTSRSARQWKKATAEPKSKPSSNWAENYRSASGEKPYHHKCTVCGRTDTEYPDLEFRYCSRCAGYRCYCMDHINNHVHITE